VPYVARVWHPRFHIPLIKPDVRISRIRLSDKTSRLRPRLLTPPRAQTYEPKVPVQVREWIAPALALSEFVFEAPYFVTTITRRLQPCRYLHNRSGCYWLEPWPGGTLTHRKAPPFHGARRKRSVPSACCLAITKPRGAVTTAKQGDERRCVDDNGFNAHRAIPLLVRQRCIETG
jgi:hypothetical protein